MVSHRVTVSHTAPTLIVDQGGEVENVRVWIRNMDATNVVDLGGSAVTAGAGYPVKAGELSPAFILGRGDKLYGIATTADVQVAV